MKRVLLGLVSLGLCCLFFCAGPSGLHAQTCKLKSNGMCASPGAVCSPIDNPDVSSASKGNCNTKVGRHPAGNTCECEGVRNPTRAGLLGAMDVLPHDVKHPIGSPSDPPWDDNNFLRNPVWRFAKFNNGTIPDLCAFCPCDSNEPTDWNKRPSCTAQSVFSEGSIACSYHMNWFPVEYEGFIDWGGKSDFFEDNDYTFSIHRDRDTIDDRALETTARTGVHLEFDSSETVNHFDNTKTWWDDFHHNRVDKSDEEARQAINDKFAMVIGLFGIDSQHGPHTEIHPVYAIFVKRPGLQPNEDRWAFFVRNFGNEGYCGADNPPSFTQLQIRIPGTLGNINRAAPVRGTVTTRIVAPFSDTSLDRCRATQWGFEGTTDGGILLTFRLSDPADKCGFVGDLTIAWHGSAVESSAPTSPAPPVRVSVEPDVEDPVLSSKISKLDPSKRQQLEKQIAELKDTQPAGPPMEPSRLPHVKPASVHPALPNYGKGLKAVKDPAAEAREEKKRQLISTFLKANGIE